MNLEGFRTYLLSGGIIVHQGLKLAGFDVDEALISNTIDAVLGLGAIFYRWKAALKAKKDVEVALNTPVPTNGGQ